MLVDDDDAILARGDAMAKRGRCRNMNDAPSGCAVGLGTRVFFPNPESNDSQPRMIPNPHKLASKQAHTCHVVVLITLVHVNFNVNFNVYYAHVVT